jgi:hypothetical protein
VDGTSLRGENQRDCCSYNLSKTLFVSYSRPCERSEQNQFRNEQAPHGYGKKSPRLHRKLSVPEASGNVRGGAFALSSATPHEAQKPVFFSPQQCFDMYQYQQ